MAMVIWRCSLMTNYASFIYDKLPPELLSTHVLLKQLSCPRPEAHHALSRMGTLRERDSEMQSVWHGSRLQEAEM